MVPWDKMPVLQWDAYESDWKSTLGKDTQQTGQAKCPASLQFESPTASYIEGLCEHA